MDRKVSKGSGLACGGASQAARAAALVRVQAQVGKDSRRCAF